MFGRQKPQTDVKKSTIKFLDSKKDVPTRLKHLKLILDSVDLNEAKTLFATNYSHIYHLVYEGIVCAEGALKLKGGLLSPTQPFSLSTDNLFFSFVHRAQREELESVLQLFERVIILLPDLLHCRWQLHSIARLMAKLNHPGNSVVLRKQAMRLFLMWYQCLGGAAPSYVHAMFASLVPGLPGAGTWPPPADPSLGIAAFEITPVMPTTSGERLPDDATSFFLEWLLDCMVSQVPKIHWNDGSVMWSRSIEFLYERFRELYLPRIFQDFKVNTDIYKPHLELPEPRKTADLSSNVVTACQVVFIKWIANYAHSVYRSTDCTVPGQMSSLGSRSHHPDDAVSTSSQPSSLGDRDSITSYTSVMHSDVDANVIAKDVILGSRANINFLHEVFRRALLMNFVQTVAIRRVICVYKDWIQMNVPELPVFMLEPEEGCDYPGTSNHAQSPEDLDVPKNRLRTDSYYGAIGLTANNNREEYSSHLRAGAQNILQVFFCNSASVFLLFQTSKHDMALPFLEEQVDICKRVLNIYRYAVMNTRMSSATWEQLLVVLLHITSKVLDPKQSHFAVKNPDSLGSKLAGALFQTLIVSWVKASLNVPLSTELWDRFQSVLSQLTFCDDVITEWAKTMETLTRVLSRHVYNLDLANLPLDRLSEQKSKKKRLGGGGPSSAGSSSQTSAVAVTNTAAPQPHPQRSPPVDAVDGKLVIHRKNPDRKEGPSSSDRRSLMNHSFTTPTMKRKLKRSLSDGNLLSPKKIVENETSTDSDFPPYSIAVVEQSRDMLDGFFPFARRRKRSHSMDSVRKLKIASHFGHIGQPGALNPEWAELSSSTASLDNASTIHIDDTNSFECGISDHSSQNETKGVIAGGNMKGWLPSVAAILWRRMLGILGNVNEFTNPKIHAHFFQVLTELWSTLHKVRMNQGISEDNLSTPRPNELCPPLTVFAGWCFQALELSQDYFRGKVLACSLLCDMVIANQDIQLPQEFLTQFYASIHKTVITNQQDLTNEIIRRCGCRFVSKMLPGFSLLFLDLCQASHSVLTSKDLKKAPRMEAASVLGGILTVSEVCKELPILKPKTLQYQPVTSHPTSDVVFQCLLQFSKMEQTSHARVVCLQSLAIYLCKELLSIRYTGFRPAEKERAIKIGTIVTVLLESVKVANRNVAIVASDVLMVLADFAGEISTYFPGLVPSIVLGVKFGLQQALPLKNSSWKTGKPVENEKRLLISLLLTLGEWCMRLPLDCLLTGVPSLLSAVFEVLHMVMVGFQLPGTNDGGNQPPEDFEPSIPFDDLQLTDKKGKMNENETSFSKTNIVHSPSQDLETVRLAARTLAFHFLTQMGHFPMSSGASKCGSIVSENDDIQGSAGDFDELSAEVFLLPNVQMFAFNRNCLLSIIELPSQEHSQSGMTGLTSSSSQVRIIIRDISGKVCWDAAHLWDPCRAGEDVSSATVLDRSEEQHYLSTITGAFLSPLGPRLTVRSRATGVLPTEENSADDLDNLDDLLSYIGTTSAECLQRIGEPLSTPWTPPSAISQENEDDFVAAVVNQRNSEIEFLHKFDMDLTMTSTPASLSRRVDENDTNQEDPSITNPNCSAFMLSRRIFSHLGLTGWDKRNNIEILRKDDKLLRELKHLDSQKCRETHKIAVIYVAEGQEDKQSILSNSGGSELYEDFVSGLGWEVDLETHSGFMGGLQRNKSTGETAPYYATSFTEVIFHVATRMPSTTEECLLQKTRHLGNDEVHVVWSEHHRDYRRDIIPTEFCDVLIVIYPLRFGLFRIQVSRKPEVPYFGPLYDEAIVERDVLPMLVRATAVNASRAKRSSLQFFQHYFEEREKSLTTAIQNQKSRSTFEGFASRVFCPILPPPVFPSGVVNRASFLTSASSSRFSGVTVSSASNISPYPSTASGTGSQLSPAVFDSCALPGANRRPYDIPFTPPEQRSGRSSGIGIDSSSSFGTESPIPPLPPKKLGLKLGAAMKPKLQTPPASPVPSLRVTDRRSDGRI